MRVQGSDYAYTLQGWLKGVNPAMGGTLTNGTDTTEPYPVAQDVYGFSLNYYKSDYKAIGYSPQATSVLGALGSNAAPLYNGNIAAMVVNIPKFGATKLYNYHYDQLNRIVAMDMYNGLVPAGGTFTPVSDTSYKERISYDPNGNILTYLRNGVVARPTMDNLSYYYKANTNQLHKVTDAAADAIPANYSLYNDIKQGQACNLHELYTIKRPDIRQWAVRFRQAEKMGLPLQLFFEILEFFSYKKTHGKEFFFGKKHFEMGL